MEAAQRNVNNWLQRTHGIHVPGDWLAACLQWLQEENEGILGPGAQLCKQVYEQWLFADLRELASAILPPDLPAAQKILLKNKYCLQVDSIVDAGTSYYSQLQKMTGKENANVNVSAAQPTQPFWEPKPKRMLLLSLTDGVTNIQAMEYKPISALSTSLAPGAKIRLSGEMLCRRGMLMLKPENVLILGGEVESMLETSTQQMSLQSSLEANINPEVKVEPKEFHQTSQPSTQQQKQLLQQRKPQQQQRQPLQQQQPIQQQQQPRQLEQQHKRNTGNKVTETDATDWEDEMENEWDDDLDFDVIMEQLDNTPASSVASSNQVPGKTTQPGQVNVNRLRRQPVSRPCESSSNNISQSQQNRSCNTQVLNKNPYSITDNKQEIPANQKTDLSGNDTQTLYEDFKSDTALQNSLDTPQSLPNQHIKRKAEFPLNENNVKTTRSSQLPGQKSALGPVPVERPWTYLSEILHDPPRTCFVKAYISTLVTKLEANQGQLWSLTVKLNDGTAAVDVDLSDMFLTSLIGFSARNCMQMKARCRTEPHLRNEITNALKSCQSRLIELYAVLELEFSPVWERPKVLRTLQLADHHLQQLSLCMASND